MRKNTRTLLYSIILALVVMLSVGYCSRQNKTRDAHENERKAYKVKLKGLSDSASHYRARIAVLRKRVEGMGKKDSIMGKQIDSLLLSAKKQKQQYKPLSDTQMAAYLKEKYNLEGNDAINELIKDEQYYRTMSTIVPLQAIRLLAKDSTIASKDSLIGNYTALVVNMDSIIVLQTKYIGTQDKVIAQERKYRQGSRIRQALVAAAVIALIIII